MSHSENVSPTFVLFYQPLLILISGESPNAWTTNAGWATHGTPVTLLPLAATTLYALTFVAEIWQGRRMYL